MTEQIIRARQLNFDVNSADGRGFNYPKHLSEYMYVEIIWK